MSTYTEVLADGAIGDGSGYGTGFQRPITINNSGGPVLTGYQVLIILDTATLVTAGKMRSDCGDLRVYDSDNSILLPYWIDTSTVNTSTTRIWTKVDLTAGGSKTIYLLYGNLNITTTANGDNVFDFFDDFLGSSLDVTKWVNTSCTVSVSNGILTLANSGTSECRILTQGSYANCAIMARIMQSSSNDFSILARAGTYVYLFRASGQDGTNKASIFKGYAWASLQIVSYTLPNWVTAYHVHSVMLNGSSLSQSVDYGAATPTLTDASYSSGYAGIRISLSTILVDWFIVRKYTITEPTATVGSETTVSVVSLIDVQHYAEPLLDSATAIDLIFLKVKETLTDGAVMWDQVYLKIAKEILTDGAIATDQIFLKMKEILSDGAVGIDSLEDFIRVLIETLLYTLKATDKISYTLTAVDHIDYTLRATDHIDYALKVDS